MSQAKTVLMLLATALSLIGILAYALRWLWIAIIAVALLLQAYTAARAHNAPSGWAYDIECCSTTDCRPAATEEVLELDDGSWKHLPSGVIFRKDQVKPSKDKHFHICVSQGGTPYCIYVLQGA